MRYGHPVRDVDAVVIGAGPNGLVAANLLADAGWRVLVLEAQAEPGGAVRSARAHPSRGTCTTVFSAFYPLGVASPVMRALDLGVVRVAVATRAARCSAHPTADGRCAVLSTDVEETAASLRQFAAGDGDAWRAMAADFARLSGPLLDSMTSPIPPVRGPVRLATTLGPRGLLEFTRQALLSVRRLAQERFRGEGAALLLTGNAMHSDVGPDVPPSGFLGWFLTGLGPAGTASPSPKAASGELTACAGSPAHGARRRGPLRGTGRADRGARPARGRGGARRRRGRSPPPAGCSPTSARPRSTATSSARSTCPRTCVDDLAPLPVRPGDVQGRLGAVGADPVAGAEAPTHAGTVHLGDSMDVITAVRGRPRAGPDPGPAVRARRADEQGRPDAVAGGHRDGVGVHATSRSGCAATRAERCAACGTRARPRPSPTGSKPRSRRSHPASGRWSPAATCCPRPRSSALRRQPRGRRARRRHHRAAPAARLPTRSRGSVAPRRPSEGCSSRRRRRTRVEACTARAAPTRPGPRSSPTASAASPAGAAARRYDEGDAAPRSVEVGQLAEGAPERRRGVARSKTPAALDVGDERAVALDRGDGAPPIQASTRAPGGDVASVSRSTASVSACTRLVEVVAERGPGFGLPAVAARQRGDAVADYRRARAARRPRTAAARPSPGRRRGARASSTAGSAATAASLTPTRRARARGHPARRSNCPAWRRRPGRARAGRRRPPARRDGTGRRWARAPARRRDAPASATARSTRRRTARNMSSCTAAGTARSSASISAHVVPASNTSRRRRARARGRAARRRSRRCRRDRKLMPARLTTALAVTVATISRRSGCDAIAGS